MDDSHKPFLALVLSASNEFTEVYTRDYLEGNQEDSKLAVAFELWSKGENGSAVDYLTNKVRKSELEKKGLIKKEELKAVPVARTRPEPEPEPEPEPTPRIKSKSTKKKQK